MDKRLSDSEPNWRAREEVTANMTRPAKPVRLQFSRRKGFRLQEHSKATNGLDAVVVGRPTKWGNPFKVADAIDIGLAKNETSARRLCVEAFSGWLSGFDTWWTGPKSERYRRDISGGLADLAGKNLACWCPLDQPCHADVLLELANPALRA